MEEQKKKRLSVFTIAILVILAIAVIVGIIFLVKALIGGSGKDVDPEDAWLIDGYMALLDEENDVFTYSDQKGNTIQYNGYTDMEDFYFDTTCVARKSEESEYKREYALITTKQKVVVDFGIYDDINQIDEGEYYEVEKNDMYGIIDYKGNVIIPTEYDYIRHDTFQNDTQYMFICEREDEEKYDYISESGVVLTTLDDYETFTYYYTLSDDAVSLVEIDEKYFNTATGEQLFEDKENVNYKYNILLEEEKYTIYNNDLTIKVEVECPNTSYFDVTRTTKYVILEQTIKAEDKSSKKYTLFDESMNVIKESDTKIVIYEYEDSGVHFITEENGTITVTDKKGNVKFTAQGYKLPSGNLDDMYIYLRSKTNNTYDLYNLEGTKLIEGLSSIAMQESGNLEKDYMMICRREDGKLKKSMLLNSLIEIPVDESVNVIEKYKDYILTSNWSEEVVKIYNLNGEQVGEDIPGTWSSSSGKYIKIQTDDKYMIYDLETATKTFEYNKADYVNIFEEVRLVELSDGFYNFVGEKILERIEQE